MSTNVILETTTSLESNPMTWGKAKAWVARGVGSPHDSQLLYEAGEAITMAIQEWNTRHSFGFLERAYADITMTTGDDTYALPSDFLRLYGVPRLEGIEDRPLFPAPRHLLDRLRRIADSDDTGIPTHYHLFEYGTTGQITLVPIPVFDGTLTLKLKYYRPISEPTIDQQGFDLPKRWIWGILARAKSILLADHAAENRERLGYWTSEAERLFRAARADDVGRSDDTHRFTPRSEWAGAPSEPNSPLFWEGA